ncbi:PREDICTED: TNF receptor-associated factor 6-A-like [Amphimedon queenslandica]|uniref:RING-type domain-containing protein n=1 Tax=Amphimedon queenslandica TaxID=400682 RepID=A0A1X7UMS8_AMPQE|nr:PREDICTED: TNF receptor-associated factor 6-A-like [Amphimedon queenslandica]|eukprot:XP_011404660.1 PREDICTED: TNF receptor-associated factor 6-A-like [Amphimedon queenslandica]
MSRDDFKFEEEFSHLNIDCPICLNIIISEPRKTSCCGRHFCKACISKVTGSCPLCRGECQTYTDKKFKRIVYSKTVQCMKKRKGVTGCGWKGELRFLKDHFSTSCPYVIVQCLQECDQKDILRIDLDDHLENHCPMQPVECPFSWLGCDEWPLRKDVEKHYSDTKHAEHFEVAYRRLLMANKQFNFFLDNLEKNNAYFNMRCYWLGNELDVLKKKHDELKNSHDKLLKHFKIISIIVVILILVVLLV